MTKAERKPRIIKKLSKRLAEILPKRYCDHWVDDDVMEGAYDNNTRVKGCLMIGGGVDYWGEGQDAFTICTDFSDRYEWMGMFGFYPDGHQFEYWPVIDPKKRTGKRLIDIAKLIAANNEQEFNRPVKNIEFEIKAADFIYERSPILRKYANTRNRLIKG